MNDSEVISNLDMLLGWDFFADDPDKEVVEELDNLDDPSLDTAGTQMDSKEESL